MLKLVVPLGFVVLAAATAERTGPVSPVERAAASAIRAEALRGRIRFLASDLLEGRGPATTGDKVAEEYIARLAQEAGNSAQREKRKTIMDDDIKKARQVVG